MPSSSESKCSRADDEETRRLAEIFDRGFDPPPALLQSLRRLADPEREAPPLTWTKAPA